MKRSLCLALCPVVLWILLWYDPPDRPAIRLPAAAYIVRVAEINGVGEDLALVVQDVTDEKGNPACDRMLVYSSTNYRTQARSCSFSDLKIGNIIRIRGTPKPLREPGNPGQFNEKIYYHSLGIETKFYAEDFVVLNAQTDRIANLLHTVRLHFCTVFSETLPEREAGIISAMVLGEKSGLDDEIRELYRENGIAHVLAISGLHISLIGFGLFALLRKTVLPMQAAAAATGIILLLYVELTGFPVATRRAVIMTIILLMARVLGERFDRLNALALAALLELITHPESLYQSGFLLSYGTVLGIILFVDEFKLLPCGPEKSIRRLLFSMASGSLGITMVTLPILVQCYHDVAVFSVLVNTLWLPFMSVILGVSILGGGLGFLSFTLARFALGIVYDLLWAIRKLCEWIALIPWHLVIIGNRSVAGIVLYYAVLVGVVVFLRDRKMRADGKEKPVFRWLIPVLAVNVLVLLLPVTTEESTWLPAFSRDGLTITNLDVGQGDCCCIRTSEGHTILIDGGSSDVSEVAKYRIVPYLKYMGVSKVDAMILTHSDADHTSGFIEILEKEGHFGLGIGGVILPEICEPDENYLAFLTLAKEQEIPVRFVHTGDRLQFGEAQFLCLHPSQIYEWVDANDYSTVMALTYGRFTGLFTGDLGFHGEDALAGELEEIGLSLPDVDYLKVGHHGSKTSSSEGFLDAVRPEIAVASAGEGNRYHHPSAEAVERLKAAGSAFYCTIECGAVTTRTNGTDIQVATYR